MKLLLENWRQFLAEGGPQGIAQDIDEDVFDKVLDWAGVVDKGSISHLGSASMGSAYKINSGDYGSVALKITNDHSEAHSVANLLKSGASNPNVYKVYKVARLPGRGRPKYAIITELLEQPSKDIQYAMGSLYPLVLRGEKGLHKWKGYGFDEVLDAKLEAIISDSSGLGFDPESVREHINKIANALTFLKAQGIDFTDLKASNVLQRGSEPVIIDLGRIAIPKYMQIKDI